MFKPYEGDIRCEILSTPKTDKFEVILLNLKQFATTKGSELLILYIPPSFRYMNQICNTQTDNSREVVLDLIRKNKIQFLDLTDEFNDAFYFEYDFHWNEEGHLHASNLIYNKLMEGRNGK